ncbi:hypothetical protein G3N56_18590 [Desulfovibrio sulfodismutans]|uniref:Uncharacterized protein n=1 Tax=Desulfolutivibrio sulfodismutans TaxID=63561 RepID=A0A7K3NRD0_9BACT|nr:hypothetical protein [Desulfolutivibrio sulfodismutans]NDY58748.1 hypothetical protein [Desulfolutivibrio sulfodismutans]QLA12745.1 hypothetical protein GD606_10895 [Desulfolutivibrio sulfodismutans DSM 3696]
MSSIVKISDMPQTQTSIRQNQLLMDFMQTSNDARNAEQDAALAMATTKESLLENSLKGSLLVRTG